MKRHRTGQHSVGARPWVHSLVDFYGEAWWESFDGGWAHFMQYARHVCTDSMMACLQRVCKGLAPTGVPVFLNEEEDGRIHVRKEKEDSKQARDRLSKRIALHNMRCTQWDLVTMGIPVEVQGDSLLVVNWLNGRWAVENRLYQRRVDYLIDTLDGMQSMFGTRPPEAGRDIVVHSFREWNQRADLLTHEAREGRSCTKCNLRFSQHEYHYLVPCLVRAGFDGGVCAKGSACGVWIDLGLRSTDGTECIMFTEVYSCCWMLSDGATVTETELSAVEHVVAMLPQVVQSFF